MNTQTLCLIKILKQCNKSQTQNMVIPKLFSSSLHPIHIRFTLKIFFFFFCIKCINLQVSTDSSGQDLSCDISSGCLLLQNLVIFGCSKVQQCIRPAGEYLGNSLGTVCLFWRLQCNSNTITVFRLHHCRTDLSALF